MALLKYKNSNNQWEAMEYPGTVKITEQPLSNNEQLQVLTNLGLDTINLEIIYDDDSTETYYLIKKSEV